MKPIAASAQITVWGIVIFIIGSVISSFGWMYEITESMTRWGSDGGGAIAGVIGMLISGLGAVLTLVGIYRALSKIDAIEHRTSTPVTTPSPLPLHTVKQDEQERGQADQDAGDLSNPGAGAPASGV